MSEGQVTISVERYELLRKFEEAYKEKSTVVWTWLGRERVVEFMSPMREKEFFNETYNGMKSEIDRLKGIVDFYERHERAVAVPTPIEKAPAPKRKRWFW